jgi:hypothetical protein
VSGRADPFSSLLDTIDRRVAKFGPDRTAFMGYYFLDPIDGVKKVLLDSGQLVPTPVLIGGSAPLGARYVCVWMQNGHDVGVIIPKLLGKIFGLRGDDTNADGDEWFVLDTVDLGTDTAPGVGTNWVWPFDLPDDDAWYIGDLGFTKTMGVWLAGGTDNGEHTYAAVVAHAGDWFVDKFNADCSVLLERWPIPGWSSWGYGPGWGVDPYLYAQGSIMHLASNPNYVTVMCDLIDPAAGPYGFMETMIRFVVFSTDGTLLNQWDYSVPADVYGNTDSLFSYSGSCVDDTHLYFCYYQGSSSFDFFMARLELVTGNVETLFDIGTMDAAITALDPTWNYGPAFPHISELRYEGKAIGGGIGDAYDILLVEGDLILVGDTAGMVRVQLDGTPVWWTPRDGDAAGGALSIGLAFTYDPYPTRVDLHEYNDRWVGLGHSGRGTILASKENIGQVDEFAYDGTFIKTHWPGAEPYRHLWPVNA